MNIIRDIKKIIVMKKNNEGVVVVATKVNREEKEQLKIIANILGLSLYEMIHDLIIFLLKSMDEQSEISDDHKKLYNSFINSLTKIGSNGILDFNNENIERSIAIIKKNKEEIPQIISIEVKNNNTFESFNNNNIISDVLEIIDPKLLDIIKKEKEEKNYFSIADTLKHILIKNLSEKEEMMINEIRKQYYSKQTTQIRK